MKDFHHPVKRVPTQCRHAFVKHRLLLVTIHDTSNVIARRGNNAYTS